MFIIRSILPLAVFVHICTTTSYGQHIGRKSTAKETYVKQPALGIHFFLNDFRTAENIRQNSLSDLIRNHKIARLKDMERGLALSYLRGISDHFDYSITVSGFFSDMQSPIGKENSLGLEADGMIQAKLLNDRHIITPYIAAGVGVSKYNGRYGAFLPMGLGFQISLWNEFFLLANAQYRLKMVEGGSHHFYYSFGIAGEIGKKKERRRVFVNPGSDSIPIKIPDTGRIIMGLSSPLDTDGDGISDDEDKCPRIPGVARYQGCPVPDTDGDGINDEEDKCPGIPGPKEGNGCPVLTEAMRREVKEAAKNILFTSGSAELLSSSFKHLQKIARMLQRYEFLRITIEGHTDSTGNELYNLQLSRERAEQVKKYLMQQGINNECINVIAYGQTRPVADNKTVDGRRQNRRVDLTLYSAY